MSWENKVVWTEGLFLQPQHLQQQDRYVDRLVRASTMPLRPFAWGLTELSLDSAMLTLGKFAVRSVAGIMPDGTPFNVPGDVDPPKPLDLAESTRNLVVYLQLPTRQPGGVEVASPQLIETVARYATDELEAVDINAGYTGTATVPVGKLRLRYALENEARSGFTAIGLARIVEVRAGKSTVLDEGFIPPMLASSASGVIGGFINHLQGLIRQRAEALAGRVS
jgi:type VI secretion system protein ImpJ